jgi:hypothetical protein
VKGKADRWLARNMSIDNGLSATGGNFIDSLIRLLQKVEAQSL